MKIAKLNFPVSKKEVQKLIGERDAFDAIIIIGFKGNLFRKMLSIRHDVLPLFWHRSYEVKKEVHIFIEYKTKPLEKLDFTKFDPMLLAIHSPVYYCFNSVEKTGTYIPSDDE